MMKLLDIYCGAGGCSVGYQRAGFDDITGVDNKPQPHYPFWFIQADAVEYLRRHGHEYDFIHASPPCQRWSIASARHRNEGKEYPDLLTPTRNVLDLLGVPYVIEGVPGSPLKHPVVLCGLMFNLHVFRHRLFETSFSLPAPKHPSHTGKRIGEGYYSVAGGTGRWKSWGKIKPGVTKGTIAQCSAAMGIDWMTRKELTQAIPPAYTEYIGKQLLKAIKAQ